MNVFQITMVLQVYQKHQLPFNEPYQITFLFYRCDWKKNQDHRDASNQTVLPFLNNFIIN